MPASGFNLTGNVELNAGGAIRGAEAVASRLRALSENGRASSATLKATAQALDAASRAANRERDSLVKLAAAQAQVNKVNRESLAATRLQNAKSSAVRSGASDKALVAEGQRELLNARALTETYKQQIAEADAAGRAKLRAAQLSSAATRDEIAQQRLGLAQQEAQQRAVRFSENNAERLATSYNHIGSALTHVGVLGVAVFAGISAVAVEMQKQFAAVERTSSLVEANLTPKQRQNAFDALRLQFDALSETLPITYKELTQIGAAANQLGIQAPDLARFTKAVAQFSATTGVSVDTTATAFGRLNSLVVDVTRNGKAFGGVDNDFQGLADAINKVGVNSVATDQQIINIASQISGIANVAGLGYKEIVGFSGALASVGVQPFLARGLSTRLFSNIISAVNDGGKSLTEFARVSGLTNQQFIDEWRSEPSQVLVKLMQGIRNSGSRAIDTLKDLGVKSVLDQPALLRLANAADKTGKAGALLAQTFRDANDAAGTGARQYAVIANTVQSRLQVAFNRAQIAVRDLGESNLGPLTQSIDVVSKAILQFTQGLDKPFKLLGSIELPFTNGQLLGTIGLFTGIAGALSLVVGLGAKFIGSLLQVRNGVRIVRQAVSLTSQTLRSYATNGSSAATTNAEIAVSADGAAAATTRLAAAENAAAVAAARDAEAQATAAGARVAAARAATSATPLAFPAISQAAAAESASRTFAVNSAGVATIKSTTQQAGLLSRALTNAQGAGSRLGSALTSSLSRAGGAVKGLASGLFSLVGGPVGLVALGSAAVLGGVEKLRADVTAAGSSVDQVTTALANARTQAQLLSQIKVATPQGFLGLNGNTIAPFAKNVKELNKDLSGIGQGGFFNDLAAITNETSRGINFANIGDGLTKIKDAFNNLNQSGSVDTAVVGLQKFFHGVNDSNIRNALTHGGFEDVVSGLTVRLNEAGISAGKNNENIVKLLNGTLKLNDASSKAARTQSDLTTAFNNQSDAAAAFSTAQQKIIDNATDLNAAYQTAAGGAKNGTADFGKFIKQANDNFNGYVQSQLNAVKIARDTGADITALSTLDPHILEGAVKSGRKGEQELAKVMQLKDATGNFETAIATLSQDPGIYNAFNSLGKSTQKQIIDGVLGGETLQQAFESAGAAAKAAFERGLSEGANASGAALAGQVKQLSAIQATIKLTADPKNAIKTGETAADYISGLKAQYHIDADSLPAIKQGESAAAYITRLKTIMTIEANGIPAQNKGEQAAAYINRLKGTITALGNTAPAIGKSEDATHYINRLKGIIRVLAQTGPAQSDADKVRRYINALSGHITVGVIDNASATIARIAAERHTTFIDAVVRGGNAPPASIAKPKGATGGYVRGPGTATSDSIAAYLSNGEYVIRASQTAKHLSLLNDINYGRRGFATGGHVTSGTNYEASRASISSANGNSNISVVELSAYDRHLLNTIAERTGIAIEPSYIAQATTSTFRTQTRRGNG